MLLGRFWRSGRLNVASVASVFGSNMYSSGPVVPMQIEITRPRRSNVIDPQSRLMSLDSVCGLRPSGPPHLLTSVCQPLSWISATPLRAMNGLCGVGGMPRIGRALAGLPMYEGGGGIEIVGIGIGA